MNPSRDNPGGRARRVQRALFGVFRTDWLLFGFATLGSGAVALRLGQDVNFDQLSYHIYLGWSLLAGRLDQDIAPAGFQACLNPLVQAAHYLGLTRLPVRVFFVLLGAVHGVNGFLVYRLARHVLRGTARERSLSALAGIVAATGPCAVSLLATTFGDNLLSLLVLAAFLLLVQVSEDPEQTPVRRLSLAGALGGAAVGLKLTFAVPLLGLLASALFLTLRLRRPRLFLAFGSGATLGLLLAAGHWGYRLWRRFGNPFFPFANPLFPTPYRLPLAGFDERFAIGGWTDLLTTPVHLALGVTDRLQEIAARDIRYLVLFLLATAVLVRFLARRPKVAQVPPCGSVVIVGWLVLYGAWVLTFHYYRYFAVGEFLAPVAILALMRRLGARWLSVAWTAVATVICLTASTGSWGRADWTEGPLRVRVPFDAAATPAVVLVDRYGVSFALPFFPPGVRFFGVSATGEGFQRLVRGELQQHHGPVFRLRLRNLPPTPLGDLGLRDAGPCEDFRTGGRGRLILCRLERVRPAQGPSGSE